MVTGKAVERWNRPFKELFSFRRKMLFSARSNNRLIIKMRSCRQKEAETQSPEQIHLLKLAKNDQEYSRNTSA